jgi:hypothetical protein
MILACSTFFLKDLEPIVADWSSRQRVGQLFIRIAEYLKIYSQYVLVGFLESYSL